MKKHDYKLCRPIIVWRMWPTNNYRKMHGEKMMRYKSLEKAVLDRIIRPISKKSNRHVGLRFSIPIIDEMHEYKGVINYEET